MVGRYNGAIINATHLLLDKTKLLQKKKEVTVDKCNKTIMKGMCLQIGKTNKGLLMKKTTQQ